MASVLIVPQCMKTDENARDARCYTAMNNRVNSMSYINAQHIEPKLVKMSCTRISMTEVLQIWKGGLVGKGLWSQRNGSGFRN